MPNSDFLLSGQRVRRTVLWGLVTAAAVTLGACSTNPVTGQPQLVVLDEEDEAAIGKAAHPRIVEAYGGAYEEGDAAAYVESIVRRIAAHSAQPDLPYTSTVLDSPMVNAIALPGGYVYVTRGLLALASDEAELAGVIAHEISHVNARHVAQRQTAAMGTSVFGALLGSVLGHTVADQIVSIGAEGLLAGYSREQESEADELAVTYLARAGYDPFAVRDFLVSINAYSAFEAQRAGEEYDSGHTGWLSSHPSTAARIRDAEARAQSAARVRPAQTRGRDQYFAAVDGLLYGESPEDGFIRDRDFIHVEERFRFTVPEGFRLANTRRAVWAIGPDKSIVKFDEAAKPAGTDIVDYLVDDWAAALALADVRRFEVGGLSAASARTRLHGFNTLVVALEAAPSLVYRFLIGVSPQASHQYDAAFREMIGSFRLLSEAEAASVGPLRLRAVRFPAGVAFAQFADGAALGEARVDRMRLLNALAADASPEAGSLVKTVVEDR